MRPARLRRQTGWICPVLLIGGIVVIWEIAVRLTNAPLWLLPAPSDVLRALVEDRDILLPNALVTLLRGPDRVRLRGCRRGRARHRRLPFADAEPGRSTRSSSPARPSRSRRWRHCCSSRLGTAWSPRLSSPPWLDSSRSSSTRSRVCAATDRDVVNLLRSFGASRGKVFRLAEFPSSLPSIFAGARIAVAICVIGAVFGELVGARAGLGYLMIRAIAQFETPRMVAAIVLLSVMSTGLFATVGLVERAVLTVAQILHHDPLLEPKTAAAHNRLTRPLRCAAATRLA